MRPALVTISYRQLIDATMTGWFERAVLKASYDEFLLKSQNYNPEGKFKTFKEMVANDGRANSLHYKCAFPAAPYIELLKNEIPTVKDNTGNPILFKGYEFKLIDADITTPITQQVSITYTSNEFTLLDNAGDYLLLTSNALPPSGEPVTGMFLLRIAPGIAIASYREIKQAL